MKLSQFVLSMLICLSSYVNAQQDTLWTHTYGGIDNDHGEAINPTIDGGYIITGDATPLGSDNREVMLLKINFLGNEEWNQTFGAGGDDKGFSVQQTADGGYIIVATTNSYGNGDYDVWLIKTDQLGNEEWNQTFGGSAQDQGFSVKQTADGGFIVTGTTLSFGVNGDLWLIKTDSQGNEEWNRTFGGNGSESGESVQELAEGGYIITGHTSSFGNGGVDVWLIKTDALGLEVWSQTFGGSFWDSAYSTQETESGGFIIVGGTDSFGSGGNDVWLIKTDSQGDEEWNQTFGGSEWETGFSVQETVNGGYIITGGTTSFGNGDRDVWLIKTNPMGEEEWNQTFGGELYDVGNSVKQTVDGGYILIGSTLSFGSGGWDAWVIRIGTSSGNSMYFSEYMDGTGHNRGLEIYNGTSGSVNLSGYQIAQSRNGDGWQYYHNFPEGTTLEDDSVWVIVPDQALPETQERADEILGYPSVVHYSGDDARALIRIVGQDTTWLDIIGDPNYDPGAGWNVAGIATATQNHTLIRKSDINMGNTNWTISAGTDIENSEWIVAGQDFHCNLGFRQYFSIGAVTFSLDMSFQASLGNFNPESDFVNVAGTFNDWGEIDLLTDDDGDGIYKCTVELLPGDIEYTFNINGDMASSENVPNRTLTIVEGEHIILPAVWYNDEIPVTWIDVEVYLELDMTIQLLNGNFNPDNGDIVAVRGETDNYGNWGGVVELTLDPEQSNIYTNHTRFDSASFGTVTRYKFAILPGGNPDTAILEDLPNRSFTVTGEELDTDEDGYAEIRQPRVHFDNLMTLQVNFSVDMSFQRLLGNFNPSDDFVDVAGSFNDWGAGDILADDNINDIYTGTFNIVPGEIEYLFRINGAWEAAETVSHRIYTVQGGDNATPRVWFNDQEFTNKIIISEIMQNPSSVSDNGGEWFELFNANEYVSPIQGYTIKDNGSDIHIIQDNILMEPTSFIVLGNNSNNLTNGGLAVDYQFSNFTLGNSDDEIILVDLDGVTVDSVAWDGGPNFPDLSGVSMALLDPGLDNSIGSNWTESSTPFGLGDLGTPGLPNFLSNIFIIPSDIDFDTVFVGQRDTMSITIENIGNAPLQIDSLGSIFSIFEYFLNDSLIETSSELEITFEPAGYGPAMDTVYIYSNDPDERVVGLGVTGFGYFLSPDIELSSTSIDFEEVMDGLTKVELFQIYNWGDVVLEIDTIFCTDYFSASATYGEILPGDSLSLEVSFSPDDETGFEGTLTIVAGNDPDEEALAVDLTGVGTAQAPIMTVSTDELYFGVVVPNETVARQITIYNEGMIDLEIEELTFSGSEHFTTTFSDASLAPGESINAEFQFLSTVPINQMFATATLVAAGVPDLSIELSAGYFGPVWYISTTGNDDTGFGTQTNPFATIEHGVSVSSNRDTLLVAPGNYNIDMNVQSQDTLVIASHSLLYPDEDNIVEQTILQGQLRFVSCGNIQYSLIGLTSKLYLYGSSTHNLDLKFQNMRFNTKNISDWNLVFFVNSYGTNRIQISDSFFNAVVAFSNFQSEILNCIIYSDTLNTLFSGGTTSITSSTILGNIVLESPSNLTNTIARDGYLQGDSADINAAFSNIEGGWAGDSNIDEDPQFCDPANGDYHLAESSPCVGTGLNGTNMGALGVGCTDPVAIIEVSIPTQYMLEQNYPNPFNPTTTIRYGLPEDSNVSLVIYDIRGNVVQTLESGTKSAGRYNIVWNGQTDDGRMISTGIYFARFVAGDYSQVIKMLYLK